MSTWPWDNPEVRRAERDTSLRWPKNLTEWPMKLNLAELERMSRPNYRNAAALHAELAERAAMWGME